MQVSAISFREEEVGKTIKSSKRRLTWVIDINGRQHRIEFTNSTMTTKKKVVINGEIQYHSKTGVLGMFAFPFDLDGHMLNLQETNRGFDLRVNNVAFHELMLHTTMKGGHSYRRENKYEDDYDRRSHHKKESQEQFYEIPQRRYPGSTQSEKKAISFGEGGVQVKFTDKKTKFSDFNEHQFPADDKFENFENIDSNQPKKFDFDNFGFAQTSEKKPQTHAQHVSAAKEHNPAASNPFDFPGTQSQEVPKNKSVPLSELIDLVDTQQPAFSQSEMIPHQQAPPQSARKDQAVDLFGDSQAVQFTQSQQLSMGQQSQALQQPAGFQAMTIQPAGFQELSISGNQTPQQGFQATPQANPSSPVKQLSQGFQQMTLQQQGSFSNQNQNSQFQQMGQNPQQQQGGFQQQNNGFNQMNQFQNQQQQFMGNNMMGMQSGMGMGAQNAMMMNMMNMQAQMMQFQNPMGMNVPQQQGGNFNGGFGGNMSVSTQNTPATGPSGSKPLISLKQPSNTMQVGGYEAQKEQGKYDPFAFCDDQVEQVRSTADVLPVQMRQDSPMKQQAAMANLI